MMFKTLYFNKKSLFGSRAKLVNLFRHKNNKFVKNNKLNFKYNKFVKDNKLNFKNNKLNFKNNKLNFKDNKLNFKNNKLNFKNNKLNFKDNKFVKNNKLNFKDNKLNLHLINLKAKKNPQPNGLFLKSSAVRHLKNRDKEEAKFESKFRPGYQTFVFTTGKGKSYAR
jgi:hypothetical protein